jgi:hypothetical protein
MSVLDRVRAVPRAAVGAGLGAARLPLRAAARATGQRHNEQWPPSLAFEGIEAGVETVLGSLLRDERLVDRGRVRQAKVAQLRKAATLSTLADQRRDRADAEFAHRRAEAEQQRRATEKAADRREEQAKRTETARKQKVRQQAAKKAAANRRVKAAQEETLQRQDAAAKAEVLAEEAEAIEAEKRALEAEKTVDVIDDTIEGTKAARQTG